MGLTFSPGTDGCLNVLDPGGCVSDSHGHSRLNHFFYEGNSAVNFRRQGQHPNQSLSTFLESLKLVPTGRSDMLQGMGSSRTFLRRNIGAFHMKGGNGFGDLGIATGLSDGAKAGRHMLEGVRYDRRAEESHS